MLTYAGRIQISVVGTLEYGGGVVTSVFTIDCALSAIRLRRLDQDTNQLFKGRKIDGRFVTIGS